MQRVEAFSDFPIGLDFLTPFPLERPIQPLNEETFIWIERGRIDALIFALKEQNLSEIIQSFELFWLAFCYAASLSSSPDPTFRVIIKKNGWEIIGDDAVITQLLDVIKEIQQTFAEALELKQHIRMEMPRYRKDSQNREEISFCLDIVVSNLGKLTEMIGAVSGYPCSRVEVLEDDGSIIEQEICSCDVYWADPLHQILPEKILQRISAERCLYILYQLQSFSDWTLVCREGKIHVDSTILYLRGGTVLQERMESLQKEGSEKILFLKDLSFAALKAFAEYLYVGVLSSQFSDLGEELLEIGYRYDCPSLIDLAANLISYGACYERIERIESFAKLYKNDHLQEIYQSFLQSHATAEMSPSPSRDCWMDATAVWEMLDQKDFSPIIYNKHLFWLLFCREFSLYCKLERDCRFDVVFKQSQLMIRGQKGEIDILEMQLEEFRRLLAKARRQEKKALICFFRAPNGICTFQEQADLMDVSSLMPAARAQSNLCRHFILPVLINLCKSVGAECIVSIDFRKVTYIAGKEASSLLVNEFVIDWIDPIRVVPLKKVPLRPPFEELLYTLYEKQMFTDFTLEVHQKDGSLISCKVHSSILLAYGGKIRKMMVEGPIQNRQKLILKDILPETLTAFVNYLYLGPETLFSEAISKASLDELFCIANTYQIMQLINCCVNLISKGARKGDVERLQKLIESHYNAHLDRLQQYLVANDELLKGFVDHSCPQSAKALDLPDRDGSIDRLPEGFLDGIEAVFLYV